MSDDTERNPTLDGDSELDLDLDLGLHLDLHPDPTPAEREAVSVALAATEAAGLIGARPSSAWHEAGLQESVDRVPQEASLRSSRGALRA